MKYRYTILLTVVLVAFSLIITFLTGFPIFLLFLPFPPVIFRREKTSDSLLEQDIDLQIYCGYCGRRREENWIVCPFCGKDHEKSG